MLKPDEAVPAEKASDVANIAKYLLSDQFGILKQRHLVVVVPDNRGRYHVTDTLSGDGVKVTDHLDELYSTIWKLGR